MKRKIAFNNDYFNNVQVVPDNNDVNEFVEQNVADIKFVVWDLDELAKIEPAILQEIEMHSSKKDLQ
jgi:hypothetical protein